MSKPGFFPPRSLETFQGDTQTSNSVASSGPVPSGLGSDRSGSTGAEGGDYLRARGACLQLCRLSARPAQQRGAQGVSAGAGMLVSG